MKKLLLLMAFAVPFLFTSCGSDEAECSIEDWVGTYKGVDTCEEPSEDAELVIKDAGNGSLDIDGDIVKPDGCSVSQTVNFGAEFTIKLTLDGNKLKVDETTSFLGLSETCSYTLTK